MSWNAYIDNLMAKDPDSGLQKVQEAAIVGMQKGAESVWAATGSLAKITPEEVKKIVNKDRSALFSHGVVVGGVKCTMLRDIDMTSDKPWTMDIKTKATESDATSYNITIAISEQALVIVKGCKDIHGGFINQRAYGVADHLLKAKY